MLQGIRAQPATRTLPPLAAGPVALIAASTVGVLLLVGTRYGYHRDELYFLEASKHMAWGYVDQPPLSVALVWVSRALFGDSLLGLRVAPALTDGAMVFLTGMLCRELGGERWAQWFAALAIAVSPFLIAGHLAGPTIYDFVAWAVVSLLVMRILRTGNERLWLAVGLAVGVALQNKETILLLVGGLGIGLLLTGSARTFRSGWLWAGAAIALAMWSPNLIWQARHGWPSIEMSRNLHAGHSGLGFTLKYPLIELLLPGLWVAPVWMAGLWALWRQDRFHAYRAFAVAFAVLFVAIGLYIADRPYYSAPLFMVLLAAGSIVTQQVVAGTRRFFSERKPRRRLLWRSPLAAVAFVIACGLLFVPVSLPVLPASVLATVPLQNVNYNLGEMIGWPQLVAKVKQVYQSLPAGERRSTVILTSNYGEAGAIDRYGPALGLPQAYSGHNNYWWWGPPEPSRGVAVAVGFGSAADLGGYFRSVHLAATFHNPQGVENDEQGARIWVCTGQRAPWPAVWARFRAYG